MSASPWKRQAASNPGWLEEREPWPSVSENSVLRVDTEGSSHRPRQDHLEDGGGPAGWGGLQAQLPLPAAAVNTGVDVPPRCQVLSFGLSQRRLGIWDFHTHLLITCPRAPHLASSFTGKMRLRSAKPTSLPVSGSSPSLSYPSLPSVPRLTSPELSPSFLPSPSPLLDHPPCTWAGSGITCLLKLLQ